MIGRTSSLSASTYNYSPLINNTRPPSINRNGLSSLRIRTDPQSPIDESRLNYPMAIEIEAYEKNSNQNKQNKYDKLMQKLDELDRRAEDLIEKKLRKIGLKSYCLTLKDKGRDEISQQLQGIIKKVSTLQADELEGSAESEEQIKNFTNRKISLLQKLLAENSTEADALKKYFFAISASNQKKRAILQKINNPKIDRKMYKIESALKDKNVCSLSSNKLSYVAPKSNEYQTYRYRNKEYSANVQPLPRSSYNTDYLLYGSLNTPSLPIKNIDNHNFFGKTRERSSTYSKDYHAVKADIINYKQLDSYKDKFKNIEISYAPMRNMTEQNPQKDRSYLKFQKDLLKELQHRPNASPPSKSTVLRTSETRSQYQGLQGNASGIKNKALNRLKYTYKNLLNG